MAEHIAGPERFYNLAFSEVEYVKAHLWNIVMKVAEETYTPKAQPHMENITGFVDCYEQPVWKHKRHNTGGKKATSPTMRKTSWNV